MPCVLHVQLGRESVEAFISTLQIKPYRQYNGGETRNTKQKTVWVESGFSFDTSKADFGSFYEQITDTINFMKSYYDDLTLIKAQSDLNAFFLDFGIEMNCESYTFSLSLPQEFLKLCGDLSISVEISAYKMRK